MSIAKVLSMSAATAAVALLLSAPTFSQPAATATFSHTLAPANEVGPIAPDVIVCDSSAASRAAGRTLARQTDPVPVFVRTASDRFRYMGDYVTEESLTAPLDYEKYVKNSGFTLGQISRVLKMKRR